MLLALIVSAASFMQQLDGTVIATALPQMANTFHETPVNVSIGMTAYLLTVAVFIPTGSWAADRIGSRTVFSGAIFVFTLGSVLCGFSESLWQFVGARILQAVGGALMVPVGRLVVLRMARKTELIQAMQFLTVPGLVAPVLGPPLGGFITSYASWRWIFFLNIPIGVIGLIAVFIFMKNDREDAARPFDRAGFVLSGAGFAALLFGFNALGRGGGFLAMDLGLIGVGGLLLAFAVRHARRAANPLLDLSPLRFSSYARAIAGGSLFRAAIGAMPFLLPLLFQVGFGMTAFVSGLLVMVCTIGDLSAQAFIRRIIRRLGFRSVTIFGGVATAAVTATFALFDAHTATIVLVVSLVVVGIIRSCSITAMNTLAFSDIPQTQMSAASILSSTIQQMSFGVGVAVAALALRGAVYFRGQTDQSLEVADFQVAILAIALISGLSALAFVGLKKDAGAEISGHSA